MVQSITQTVRVPGSASALTQSQLREVTQEFEAAFVEILLKQVRTATRSFQPEKSSFARQTYEEWQDQQLAMAMAKAKGIGLAANLYIQLGGK